MTVRRVTRGQGLLESFLAKQRCKMAERLIPAGHRSGRVADIGCGTYPLFLLKTRFSQKIGLDKVVTETFAGQFLEENLKFYGYDVEKNGGLPLESDSCDVVTMLAVFEHIEPIRVPMVLSEIYRVLKPQGIFILTTPAAWTDALLRLMAKLWLVSPVEIQEHKAAYSLKSIFPLLKDAGFSAEGLQGGYFELYLNCWATGIKKGVQE